jgi:hypothetical protein
VLEKCSFLIQLVSGMLITGAICFRQGLLPGSPSSGRDRSRGDMVRLRSLVGKDFGVVGSRRFESNLCAESRHISVYLARPGGITSATPSATIRLLVAS